MTTLTAANGISRRRVLALGSTLAASLAVRPGTAVAAEPIPVGVSAPQTGQAAQNGQWMRNGTSLAAKQINDRGGINGRPIQLFFEDDQGFNPTAAANAVTKLLTQRNVVAVIGPHFTPAILPVEPMLSQYRVPALTGASGAIVTQAKNPYVFRVRLNDATGARLLVAYVLDTLGWTRIGLCYVNTAFGQSGIAAVTEALQARGIRPVVSQSHLDTTKDFTPALLGFQRAGVDGIIAWTDDLPSGLLVKQRKTLGLSFGVAGSTTFSQPPFLGIAGDAAEGVHAITDFVSTNPSPEIAAWKSLYRAAYNDDPELYASTYYDAMNLLADAIGRVAAVTGPAIREALAATTNHQGVMTRYAWSDNGDMVHSGLITEVKDLKPQIVKRLSA